MRDDEAKLQQEQIKQYQQHPPPPNYSQGFPNSVAHQHQQVPAAFRSTSPQQGAPKYAQAVPQEMPASRTPDPTHELGSEEANRPELDGEAGPKYK